MHETQKPKNIDSEVSQLGYVAKGQEPKNTLFNAVMKLKLHRKAINI